MRGGGVSKDLTFPDDERLTHATGAVLGSLRLSEARNHVGIFGRTMIFFWNLNQTFRFYGRTWWVYPEKVESPTRFWTYRELISELFKNQKYFHNKIIKEEVNDLCFSFNALFHESLTMLDCCEPIATVFNSTQSSTYNLIRHTLIKKLTPRSCTESALSVLRAGFHTSADNKLGNWRR